MFTAITYRLIYFVFYLSKNILNRSIKFFIKQIFIDMLSVGLMVGGMIWWINLSELSYWSWIIMALQAAAVCLSVTIIINLIFYFDNIKYVLNRFFGRRKKAAVVSVVEAGNIPIEQPIVTTLIETPESFGEAHKNEVENNE